MCGHQWRLLAGKFQEIIIPSIGDANRRSLVFLIFHHYLEIQCIVYARPHVQKNGGVCLRLHGLCFLISLLLRKAYDVVNFTDASGQLYVHTVLTEFPRFYEKGDLRNGSTEPGEGFLTRIKHTALSFSNRFRDQALLELVIRSHFVDNVNAHCGKETHKEETEVRGRPSGGC